MTGLLYKELKLNARKIVLYTLSSMVYPMVIIIFTKLAASTLKDSIEDEVQAQLVNNMIGLVWMCFCIISFFITSVLHNSFITQDERKKWAYYISSTPTGIKGFVGVKYLASVIVGMITVTALMIMQNLANSIGSLVPDATIAIVLGFYGQMLMSAIEFPLMFRFSSKIGSLVKTVIVVAAALIGIIYFLCGDTSMFADLETFWDRIFSLAKDPDFMKKLIFWISAGMAAVIPIYYLSYRLSVKWYLKGVENYAK